MEHKDIRRQELGDKMDNTPCDIHSDPRPISRVEWPYMGAWDKIGSQNSTLCTAIVPYHEPAEMGIVTWLAIYCDDCIVWRLPAKDVLIEYAPE